MTKKTTVNPLKAALERAAAAPEPEAASPSPRSEPVRGTGKPVGASPVKPSRVGTKMISGHFAPEISAQLRMIAVEEDTTVQALLGEAIDDLLRKKAGRKVGR